MNPVRHCYIWVGPANIGGTSGYTVSLELPKDGPPVKRYFTDDTLPEELKWRLGMLNANPRVQGVGEKYSDATYFIEGTKELHSLLLDGAT